MEINIIEEIDSSSSLQVSVYSWPSSLHKYLRCAPIKNVMLLILIGTQQLNYGSEVFISENMNNSNVIIRNN